MTTQFLNNSPTVQQEVCIELSKFQDGQIPQTITVTYQSRFPYNYRFIRIDENGNYCYVLISIMVGKRRKKPIPTPSCPTICITGFNNGGQSSPCSMQTEQLSSGLQNQPYSNQLTATGNGNPIIATFSITSGNLPTGLSLSSSGLISGVPVDGGLFTFTITAVDANGCTGNQSFSIFININ